MSDNDPRVQELREKMLQACAEVAGDVLNDTILPRIIDVMDKHNIPKDESLVHTMMAMVGRSIGCGSENMVHTQAVALGYFRAKDSYDEAVKVRSKFN